MTTSQAAGNGAATAQEHRLLEAIKAIRTSIGDGLNDDEFTRFLQKTPLPSEGGFGFLSYCSGFVALSVPPQDTAKWYREKGWIAADKSKLARAIADKYGLSMYEPPDCVAGPRGTHGDTSPHGCHHLEMSFNRETIIVIHPHYLKIRLFRTAAGTIHGWGAHRQEPFGPDLLQEISRLYEH
jgi:hypothetical protein